MTCPGFLLGWFGGFFSKWFVLLRTKFKAPREGNNNEAGCTSCETFYFSADEAARSRSSVRVKRHACSSDIRHKRNSNLYKGYKYKSVRLRRKRVRISGVSVMLQIIFLPSQVSCENNNLCTRVYKLFTRLVEMCSYYVCKCIVTVECYKEYRVMKRYKNPLEQ